MRSEREGGEVDVATGENDAESWERTIGAYGQVELRDRSRAEERGDSHGAAGLDDDFHPFPDQAHSGDDFFLADQ